jgi:hypothetical protein
MGGEFGQSVAALSDLNGDTVRDLLVTQPGFGTTGRIVFLDGATGSVLGVIDGPAGASRMGLTVAAEGGTIYAGDAGGRVYIVGTPVGGLGTATLLLPAPAGAAAPAQLALIRNPVAGHDLAVGRPFTDAPATNAGSVALHVGGNPIPLFTFMGSYVAEGVGGLIAAMRDVDGDGEEEILFLSAAQGFLASGRVRIMNRAGTIVRDQILTGATGSTSWFSSIPDVTGDGRGEWLAGIVNGVAALSQGEVWASGLSLPGLSIGAAGLAATFAIDLGSGQGGRTWIQAYGISGTAPGTNFGGGMPLVPLNFDIITDYVFSLAGTPFFPDIVGTLSPAGGGSPTLNLPPAAVSLLQGLQLSTVVAAYDVPTLTITGVSNPITIPIP